MALLCSHPLPSSLRSSSLPSSSLPSTLPTPHSILQLKSSSLHPKCFNGVQLHMPIINLTSSVLVKATSGTDGTGSTESDEPKTTSESKEEAVVVENLPLESKLQERLDQKTRMKLAKKIRLRRKRLVRKRMLRKKGRWPPSKMKKLKNV